MKFKLPFRIKITKHKSSKKSNSIFARIKAKCSRFKNVFYAIILTIALIGILDVSTYLYFKTNVLGYSTRNGVIVTKHMVSKRLFEIPRYTEVSLEQLINDITIEQMVIAIAKKEHKYISRKQVIEELKKQTPDQELNSFVIRSTQIIKMLEALNTKQPKPVTEKDVKAAYEESKDTIFAGKKYEEIKDQLKQLLEAQAKQEVLLEWLQNELKQENFTYTDQSLKEYSIGTGLKLLKDVVFKHCINL